MGAHLIARFQKKGDRVLRDKEGRYSIMSLCAGDTLRVFGKLPADIDTQKLCVIEERLEENVERSSMLTFAEDVVLVADRVFSNMYCAHHLIAVRKDRCVFDGTDKGPFLVERPRLVTSTPDIDQRIRTASNDLVVRLEVNGLIHAGMLCYPDEVLVTSLSGNGRVGHIVRTSVIEDLKIIAEEAA